MASTRLGDGQAQRRMRFILSVSNLLSNRMGYGIDPCPHVERIKLRMKRPMLWLVCSRRRGEEASSLGVSLLILFTLIDAHMVPPDQLFAFLKNLFLYTALHKKGAGELPVE